MIQNKLHVPPLEKMKHEIPQDFKRNNVGSHV